MVKAVWNGNVIGQSDEIFVVEGNHYFPIESVNPEYLVASERYFRIDAATLISRRTIPRADPA